MKKLFKEKTFQLLLLMGLALAIFSCEPVMCEDCYDITYSDGTTEWVCVEYDCTNNY